MRECSKKYKIINTVLANIFYGVDNFCKVLSFSPVFWYTGYPRRIFFLYIGLIIIEES